jgi:hypothetical protein
MIVFKIESGNDTLEVNFCEEGLYMQIESSDLQNIVLTLEEAEALKNFLESHFKVQ